MLIPLPIGLLFRRAPRSTPQVFDTDGARIRCPVCAWQPDRKDRWMCSPGCGHLWNTFDTRGVCPACTKAWLHTACPSCTAWSLHDAWYERLPDSPPAR
jgi:hypothetical protein